MLNRLKEQFIFETRLTIHIVRRDRLRRMSVIPLVSGILAFSGNHEGAIIVAIMVCVSETAAYLAGAGQRIDGPPRSAPRCTMVWTHAVLTTSIYMTAGALFGASGTTANPDLRLHLDVKGTRACDELFRCCRTLQLVNAATVL
jgi:hypothetical protein